MALGKETLEGDVEISDHGGFVVRGEVLGVDQSLERHKGKCGGTGRR